MRSDARSRSLAGAGLIAIGLATALLVFLQPQGLRAPAWVAYSAALAFVCAGALATAGQSNSPRWQAWLPVALLLCMFVPAAWLAFGAGPRECHVSLPYLSGAGPAGSCRLAFGVASVIGLAMVAWAIRRAVRSAPGRNQEQPRP